MGKTPFVISIFIFLILTFFSSQITDIGDNLNSFTCFYILLMAVNLFLYFSFPAKLNWQFWLLIFIGIIFSRYFMLDIFASDDVNRYVWEGKVILEGINPYHYSPSSSQLNFLSSTNLELWQGINHKEWTAIYPPFALLVMTITAWVSPTILASKIAFTLFDIGTIFVLILLLKRLKMPMRGMVLYAFNPLILYAFSGHGHLDSLQMFFMFLSILLYYKKRWGWMFACIGLSVCSKYTSIIILPFLLNRENWKFSFLFLVAFFLPFLPFESLSGVFDSLGRFGTKMQFNDSLHGIINYFITDISISSKIAYLIIFLWYIYFYLTSDGPLRGGLVFTTVLLLFSPTIHYWYLSWIIPFIVFFPSYAWLILCTTIVFYFNVFGREDFGKSTIDVLMEYIPFYLAGIFYFISVTRYKKNYKNTKKDFTISVVLPTYNESENVDNVIQSLQKQIRQPTEVIVIDGGSNDDTIKQFKEKTNYTLLKSPEKGRGNQIYYGCQNASSEIIFIMHADMMLQDTVIDKIHTAMCNEDRLVGGCVGATFSKKKLKFSIIKFLNQFRVKSSGISFGDQGQFFYRELALKEEWVQPIPLMEDVELSIRMHSKGKTTILDGGIIASTRRWDRKQVWGNAWQVIFLLANYLFLRKFQKKVDVAKFYRRYYKSS